MAVWHNALAMKLAGISKATKDVPGGVIVRDAEGNPTGIFKDAAQELIGKADPAIEMAEQQMRDLRPFKAAVEYSRRRFAGERE